MGLKQNKQLRNEPPRRQGRQERRVSESFYVVLER
jgi:hypothetical protein